MTLISISISINFFKKEKLVSPYAATELVKVCLCIYGTEANLQILS